MAQDRLASEEETGVVMDDLGDLEVTIDRQAGNTSMEFSFNGSDPQATAMAAVVNDQIAASVSQLSDNVLRAGVMFPLEDMKSTNLVHFVDFGEGLFDGTVNQAGYGFGVVGRPTTVANMPTSITATYNGGAAGYTTLRNFADLSEIQSVQQFYGNTAMTVNFSTGNLNGSIDTFDIANDASIENFTMSGTVSGNGFSMNVTNGSGVTGTGTGAFFGPGAAEMGGQFSADAGGVITHDGVFWGAR